MDGYVVAGRATHWVTDNVRLGVTGQTQKSDADRHTILGADVLVKHSNNTWLKAEVAQSTGAPRTTNGSSDGGLTFVQNTTVANNSKSLAYRFQSSVDLKDVSDGALEGQIGAYFEHYDRGYSGQIL